MRDYSPTLMRFVENDPTSMVDGTNFYLGYGNNPIIEVDPSGMDVLTRMVKGAAIGFYVGAPVGAMAGVPFLGVGAVPGFFIGGLSGGLVGALGGLASEEYEQRLRPADHVWNPA
jgi:hypothetical protein